MFYEQLKKACDFSGIKMTPLLKELNIGTGNIASWKKGKTPGGDILKAISERLNVSIDFLTGTDDISVLIEKEKAVQETASEMDDLTDEERKEVIKYIEYIKSKRK